MSACATHQETPSIAPPDNYAASFLSPIVCQHSIVNLPDSAHAKFKPAQPLQQPPRPPHRKQPPSYPQSHLPYPQSVRRTPRRSALRSGAKPQHHTRLQQSRQSASESRALQLLLQSSPIRSPDDMLARLRAAAAPIAALGPLNKACSAADDHLHQRATGQLEHDSSVYNATSHAVAMHEGNAVHYCESSNDVQELHYLCHCHCQWPLTVMAQTASPCIHAEHDDYGECHRSAKCLLLFIQLVLPQTLYC